MRWVFVSGCFDLLHSGHVEFLEFARGQGDRLIVSIASDATVRELKREPIIPEHDRFVMVRALRCVDACFIARGEGCGTRSARHDYEPYLLSLRPEVWVIDSQDPARTAKEEIARSIGCRLVLSRRPANGPSTSRLIEQIKSLPE
jgi:cytidyltransferase-like protein